MFKWKDRKYINSRKRVFKNIDTGETLILEIQDDPDNILEESETPLTAYNLNLAQQELADELGVNLDAYKDEINTQISNINEAISNKVDKVPR